MAGYAQPLNTDNGGIKTSSIFDADVNDWLHLTGLHIKSAGGIWVPAGATNPVPTSGAAASQADGHSATLGAKADAAQTDATQTSSAVSFWKGLVKVMADVWDATFHQLAVKIGHAIALTTVTQDSTANTANTITVAAVAGKKHYVAAIEVSIKGAAAGADINVVLRDGAAARWSEVIGSSAVRGTAVGFVLPHPIEMTTNTAMTLEVDAGGAGVITRANLAYYDR